MSDVRSVPENALTCGGRGRDEVADPEPVGPLAAKYLDQLAARQAHTDPDLAARQAEVFTRLRRTLPNRTDPSEETW